MTKKTIQTTFKRIETKYIISKEQLGALQAEFKKHLVEDDYPKSTITNIYFDNENFQMVQDTLLRLYGREKLRMRTYDAQPTEDSQVFLEMKKKVWEDGTEVGHKYRLTSNAQSVEDFVLHGHADHTIDDLRLEEELDQLRERYGQLLPKMHISYSRISYKGIKDRKVRVTIDKDLIFRPNPTSITEGKYGYPLIDEDHMIMEIKVPGVMPDWLETILVKFGIERHSFSKYGTSYKKYQEIINQGGDRFVRTTV